MPDEFETLGDKPIIVLDSFSRVDPLAAWPFLKFWAASSRPKGFA